MPKSRNKRPSIKHQQTALTPAPATHEQLAELKALHKQQMSLYEKRATPISSILYSATSCLIRWGMNELVLGQLVNYLCDSTLETEFTHFKQIQTENAFIYTQLDFLNPLLESCRILPGEECEIVYQSADFLLRTFIAKNSKYTLLPAMQQTSASDVMAETIQGITAYENMPAYRVLLHIRELRGSLFFAAQIITPTLLLLETLLHHYWVKPRLVRHLYQPYDEKKPLSEDEATVLIKTTHRQIHKIGKNAGTIQLVSLGIYALLCFGLDDPTSIEFILSFLFYLVTHVSRSMITCYQNYAWQNTFDNRLRSFTQATNTDITPNKGTSLDTSFFTLRYRNQKNLAAFTRCQFVKNILLDHKIDIANAGKTCLVIPATQSINQRTVNSIRLRVDMAQTKLADHRSACQTLTQITMRLDTLQFTPRRQASNINDHAYAFFIPPAYTALLTTDRLSRLFPESVIQIRNREAILTRITTIREQKISELIKEIEIINAQLPHKITDVSDEKMTPGNAASYRQIAGLLPAAPSASAKTSDKKQHAPKQPIHWKSGDRYPSGDKHHPVTPISVNPRNTFFVAFKLDKNDFPTESSYDAFKATSEKGELGGKGVQGIRFLKKGYNVRDKYGNLFWATLDIKMLGSNFGNIRAYGEEYPHPSKEGEKLWVVKGVNLNAH